MTRDVAFYWIGVGVVSTLAVAIVAFVLFFLYARFLHERFSWILFRKGERRLSLTAWYNSRLMSDEHFHADDFPIGKRPFYLSYEFARDRRVFVLFGTVGARRSMAVSGTHPEEGR